MAADTTTTTGTSGDDKINGGSGSDVLDGGAGSDTLKGGSGSDTLIYTLTENAGGADDVYTGGSGIDTVKLQLTQEQWESAAVRAELQRYVSFLSAAKLNVQGELSNGQASDFVFDFGGGTTLTVQMMETLVVSVRNATGSYDIVDHLASLITGPSTGCVTEAGGVANAAVGVPSASGDLHADDLDGPDGLFQAVTAGTVTTLGFGSFGVTADGVWTYTVDNSNEAVQALNAGDSLTDSFIVTAFDGATKLVTITIHGTNDAAVITGTATGSVTEKGGVANGTPGDASASGDLDATDVDSSALFVVQTGVDASYGSFSIDATGAWSYTLDDDNAAVQALNTGSSPLTETVTVATADGTTHDIVIMINGANDSAVITGTHEGSVTEDAPDATVSGTLAATDVDDDDGVFQAAAAGSGTLNGYGTFQMSADGVWTYTLDNSNPAVAALANGATLSDSFTALSADGTSQVVDITINGHTDAPPNAAPTDITLVAADPGNGLPQAGVIAEVHTTDSDVGDTHTYVVTSLGVEPPIFSISGGSLIASSHLNNNAVYTLRITSTDSASDSYSEVFNIITGSGQGETLPEDVPGIGTEDILYGFNNADVIYGGAGDDTLFGQKGTDTLKGENGNDVLNGGDDHDTLVGGDGSDSFVFDSPLNASKNLDTITDFVSGTDKILLENTGSGPFTGLAAGGLSAAAFDIVGDAIAATANTRIIYNASTGALSYDADGTGAGAAIQFALVGVDTHPAIAFTDFLVT